MKKGQTSDQGLKLLKEDLKAQQLRPLYLFHGEESYLRFHYLKELQALALPAGTETFNFHQFSGKEIEVDQVLGAIDSFPMMAERSFVLISDWDIFKLGEADRQKMLDMLEDLPDYCTILLHYDLFPYVADGRTKMATTLAKVGLSVEFPLQTEGVLLSWIEKQRIPALNKRISTETARELLFYCGASMTNLITEMEKISAYALGEEITIEDIHGVATPHLNAIVFQMTDAIGAKDFDLAIKTLGDLFQMQEKANSKKKEKELGILGALSRQIRQLYMAKLGEGKGEAYVANLLGLQPFIARRVIASARRFSLEWCRQGVILCGETDKRMKSSGEDGEALLTQLLLALQW
ncbi:MAG: DNA polymerase III subunit delta [Eubacteriales bacterium]